MKKEIKEIEEITYLLTKPEVRFMLSDFIGGENGVVSDDAVINFFPDGSIGVTSRYSKIQQTAIKETK